MPTLLIFVDSLPYLLADKFIANISPDYAVNEIRPGAGFSNNIYAEIVTGLGPDEIGYFNEWELKKGKKNKVFTQKILQLFDPLRNYIYLNAGLRRLVLKRFFNLNTFNIPFKYLHLFQAGKSHNFRDIGNGNILHERSFDIYDSAEVSDRVGQRDRIIVEQSIKELRNENTLLSFVDLDNIAHIYGMESSEYDTHIKYLEFSISKIIEKYKSFSKRNKVVLFSDHGMVPVTRGVKFALESKFGPVSPDTFVYFVDSTYVRIWSRHQKILNQISGYLSVCDFGHIISESERADLGFSSREFGNLMFRANEGVMFAPNFFGARVSKAMHGYDPYLKSQSAFFSCCDAAAAKIVEMPKNTKEIYTALSRII